MQLSVHRNARCGVCRARTTHHHRHVACTRVRCVSSAIQCVLVHPETVRAQNATAAPISYLYARTISISSSAHIFMIVRIASECTPECAPLVQPLCASVLCGDRRQSCSVLFLRSQLSERVRLCVTLIAHDRTICNCVRRSLHMQYKLMDQRMNGNLLCLCLLNVTVNNRSIPVHCKTKQY